ncbi:hypothetical protein HID58_079377 [Brassica napus]|uniref:Secreted protein n=1 Tax=Brassica napus TaxID=3708 RepID=A0ABQ7Y4J9_BRANA|nr:hypothetical protein HID58_079377 [Brassica napus]
MAADVDVMNLLVVVSRRLIFFLTDRNVHATSLPCHPTTSPVIYIAASPRRESCSSFHRRDLLISHPTAISARTVVDVTYNCRGSQTAINRRRA